MTVVCICFVMWSVHVHVVYTCVAVFCGEDEAVLQEAQRLYDLHWEEPEALSSDFKVRRGVVSLSVCLCVWCV